jgi:nucleotide-binding universal stress UspA family protein
MILICYDGSEDARAAIGHAAELFRGRSATILTVWQPFLQIVARTPIGFGMAPSAPDSTKIDEASQEQAGQLVREGVALASEAGLEAQPVVCAQQGTTGQAILAQAERLDAAAIVMGSRGLTGVKSLLLGSVSHDVIQHADRTVVVVPSAEVAASRAEEIHKRMPASDHGD